ncbi:MAG: GNAT family N-acetyltransferase [Collinsella sp.]|nr:GNAT family N-acetyltransferase [Collinsella sp.]
MGITMRPTQIDDIDAAERALLDGKRALAALSIPQWQGAYPNRADIERDMELGSSYVAVDDEGSVLGVMALSFDGEGTYDDIDGAWLTESSSLDARYAVIHRCAILQRATRRGVMSAMFIEAERVARERGALSIRIDTHERNHPMRGLLSKLGYSRCGTIELPRANEADPIRVAFEKELD